MSTERNARPKLGIILPDDPIASEMHRLDSWLAARGRDDVTALTLLSRIEGGHLEDILFKAGDAEVIGPVAGELAALGCDAIVWACTSGSFIGGLSWAQAQASALAVIAARPVTSTSLAFIAALNALQLDRVHLLGAYPEPVTQAFKACLASAGISVERWQALDSPDGPSSFRLSLVDEVDRFAGSLPARGDEPILIPDTAINSLDLVEDLERRTGRTVLTANQVSLWHGLSLLGVGTAISGAGRLLAGETRNTVSST
ncbi:maleate cis-trans isomerase family protein [Nitratireductor thuwali]|uniref:Maleate isomerase n=1 Tax=Nitratireductor thuwali TaxID=2267699 RepID=A0ABY5MQU0_9HYPH|nr:Maleate isomerase [Nitratireductor thuwali]